jgi:spoIIIJ-associated protein
MDNLEENVFSGKSVEEAIDLGLTTLNLTKEEAEITILDEGKKKLFGGVKARVKVEKKASDGKRAQKFVDGLFSMLKLRAYTELLADDDRIEINIQTTNSHQVIGRHGEVLDAIQCIAGAVANIGREEYKKVVVDCENYRAGREKTLIELANKLAAKAVERGRKVTLEPMNPYERRIIHAALAESTEVKTVSEGKEPNRYVAIVPNNLKPYEPRNDRGDRKFGDRKSGFNRDRKGGFNRDRKFDREGGYNRDRNDRDGNRFGDRDRNNDRGDRNFNRDRNSRPARGKKEIHFGAYLGNSGNNNNNTNKDE